MTQIPPGGRAAQIPPENYSKGWAEDSRPPLPQAGDERSMLTAYLDWHRATFELKCAGVEPERLSERTMAPSTLTLHGLLRHLTMGERWWFQINFAGDDVPMLYYSDDDPEQDFDRLDGLPITLRGVLLKMVAEYARHNGHADLLREGIDGATGS